MVNGKQGRVGVPTQWLGGVAFARPRVSCPGPCSFCLGINELGHIDAWCGAGGHTVGTWQYCGVARWRRGAYGLLAFGNMVGGWVWLVGWLGCHISWDTDSDNPPTSHHTSAIHADVRILLMLLMH